MAPLDESDPADAEVIVRELGRFRTALTERWLVLNKMDQDPRSGEREALSRRW